MSLKELSTFCLVKGLTFSILHENRDKEKVPIVHICLLKAKPGTGYDLYYAPTKIYYPDWETIYRETLKSYEKFKARHEVE